MGTATGRKRTLVQQLEHTRARLRTLEAQLAARAEEFERRRLRMLGELLMKRARSGCEHARDVICAILDHDVRRLPHADREAFDPAVWEPDWLVPWREQRAREAAEQAERAQAATPAGAVAGGDGAPSGGSEPPGDDASATGNGAEADARAGNNGALGGAPAAASQRGAPLDVDAYSRDMGWDKT